MQMSKGWVKDRAGSESLDDQALEALLSNKATRRVVLVTLETAGAVDHLQALTEVHQGKQVEEVHPHETHEAFKVWDGAAIDAVEAARTRAHESKKTDSSADAETPKQKSGRTKKR